jgi:hypothetical protein
VLQTMFLLQLIAVRHKILTQKFIIDDGLLPKLTSRFYFIQLMGIQVASVGRESRVFSILDSNSFGL